MKLTPQGRLAALAAIVAWGFAFRTLAPGPTAVAVTLTAAIATSIWQMRLPDLRVTRQLSLPVAIEGHDLGSSLRIENRSRHKVRLKVEERASAHVRCAHPSSAVLVPGRGEAAFVSTWTAAEWGIAEFGPAQVTYTDAFGFLFSQAQIAGKTRLKVKPAPVDIPISIRSRKPEPIRASHLVSKAGDGMDYFGLREYQPADGLRSINWRATARSASPIVNQRTLEVYAKVTLILDMRASQFPAWGPPPAVVNGRIALAVCALHQATMDDVRAFALHERVEPIAAGRRVREENLAGFLPDVARGGQATWDEAISHVPSVSRPKSTVYFFTSEENAIELSRPVRQIVGLKGTAHVILARCSPPSAANGPAPAADDLRNLGAVVWIAEPGKPARVA